MAVIVFILGRPGSGKSSAARRMVKLSRRENLRVDRVNDYDILLKLYREDREEKYFKPTDKFEGFDVIDFSVLKIALKKTEEEAKKKAKSNDLVLVELARDDYQETFRQLDPAFLRKALVLFLNTDIETCIKRIRHRVAHPTTSDDHFVSKEILEKYYKDQIVPSGDQPFLSIGMDRVEIIVNRGNRNQFDTKIRHYFNTTVMNTVIFEATHRLRKRLYSPARKMVVSFLKTYAPGLSLQKG